MLIKLFTIVLMSFLCLKFISAEIKEDGLLTWKQELLDENYDKCESYMSEETKELWEDNNFYDNAEVRRFLLCIMKLSDYINWFGKMNVDNILRDFKLHVPNIDDDDMRLAYLIMKICKDEADAWSNPEDVVGVWTNCMVDRAQTPDIFATKK